ncbi:PrgI family mobile element protein [Alkalihalobacillus sp. BA299]|uniref:PrgI family mobile element protein n=1 Tax=Alkalihalobacillus sp. BA299 TaxID=2815938 RepID=UPI001AD9B6C4|nr:PrgI family protein [Alkalihalobacillus sp. BA299]
MRKVTVPIDMSSEQKTLLGVLSKRQLIYLIAGGAVVYAYIPVIWNLTVGFNALFAIITCFISALPVAAVVAVLGFIRKSKYHMYFDRYLITKYGYKKQIGVWRKGRKPAKWMEGM